ncbi:MAG: hypothetical protein HFI66_04720 [Lachnospiraceae bacterium]|jgi:hypothetical protein|nr:hypothetical protein [Lachnospiraceae bacterium]
MNNEQLAHDLAVARMAGKQLPADTLIAEYRKSYDEFLKQLESETPKTKPAKIISSPM